MEKNNLIANKCIELDIELTEKQVEQFNQYYELLIEWNSFMNLTTIVNYEEVVVKHFVDSLTLVKGYDLTKSIELIDIGTGAGFPGIPLKIVFPNLNITLLDSVNKKLKFINEVIDKLELKNIKTLHGRAEDFAQPELLREKFDLCVSRAVANLSTLTEYCLPFVKVGGEFISYKSEKLTEEMETAKKAIHLLGGKIEKQIEFNIADNSIYRNLVIIKKINKTSKQYPRKVGLPSKEPIK